MSDVVHDEVNAKIRIRSDGDRVCFLIVRDGDPDDQFFAECRLTQDQALQHIGRVMAAAGIDHIVCAEDSIYAWKADRERR